MLRRIIYILLAISVLNCDPPLSAAQETSEYKVKAAYLYNFAKFIHWPDNAFNTTKSPLVIGVLGTNYFKGSLKPLAVKKVHNRTIEIKHFKTIEEVQGCHLLYVSKSEEKNHSLILKELATQPILTVGGYKDFVKLGGIIQFVTRRDRLRFSINLAVANQNNIQIDAQLLSLAAEVEGDKK